MSHATKSGVATFVAPDEKACLDDVRYLLSLPALQQPGGAARRRSRATTPSASTPELVDLMPAIAQPALRHEEGHRGGRRRRRVLRGPPPLGHDHHLRLRPHRRPGGGHRRQPAGRAGRRARHRLLGEGGPLRPHLRRLQHPARHLRRRPRVHARHRPGVRRHHPPRGQAPLRLLRGDGAPHPDHHPQGLRRRLRGHELEVDRRRPGLRLALGRAGRDGPPGRGRDRLPARAGRGRRPGGPRGPSWSRSTPSATPTPTSPPSAATSTTSSTRPRPAGSWCAASPCWPPSARSCPSASTGTCRCDASAAGRATGRPGSPRSPEVDPAVLAAIVAAPSRRRGPGPAGARVAPGSDPALAVQRPVVAPARVAAPGPRPAVGS